MGIIIKATISAVIAFLFAATAEASVDNHAKNPIDDIEDNVEIGCLAENIYFEARGESKRGKTAVAMVTMNRVQHKGFPQTVCGVVKQKSRGICQFSWYCNRANLKMEKTSKVYFEALEIARRVYMRYNYIDDPTNGSLYFHATSINPRWKLTHTTQIGGHKFYK